MSSLRESKALFTLKPSQYYIISIIEKIKVGVEKSRELRAKLIFSASYLTFPLSCSVGSLPLITVGELGANFVYLGKVISVDFF